jgi:hypothetical protein
MADECTVKYSLFFGEKNLKKRKKRLKLSKIATIAYNTKQNLRFFYFHVLNIIKFV